MTASASTARAEVPLSLADALARSSEHAYAVQAASHDSLAAERGLRAAKAEWFPRVSLAANALGFDPKDPLGFGFLQIPADWNAIYVANLSLRYPLYTGGRRVHTIRRNREEVGAAAATLDAERLHNAYACRGAYLRLLVADRLVAAAEASLHRVEVIDRDTANRFAAGVADSVDLLETRISMRQVSRALERARNDRRNASARLARLVGTPAGEAIVPTERMPEPVALARAGLPAPEATARPELTALDRQVAALEQQRAIVKGGYWPTISTLGGYAMVRPDLGQPEVSWNSLWWVGLTFSWDLNLGGQEGAESGQALERIRSLQMTRADAAREFQLQALIARNNIDEAFELYRLSREEVDIAGQRYRLASDKADAGTLTVNRLVELEADLTAAQQELEAARLRYFLAVTDYLYALGSDELLEAM